MGAGLFDGEPTGDPAGVLCDPENWSADYADGRPPCPDSAGRSRELFALVVVTLGPLVLMSNLLLLAYLFGPR